MYLWRPGSRPWEDWENHADFCQLGCKAGKAGCTPMSLTHYAEMDAAMDAVIEEGL
jgi:hypothetical protein